MESIIIESNRGKKQLVLNNFKFWISSCNEELRYTVIRCQYVQLKTVYQKFTQNSNENNTIYIINYTIYY